MIAMIKIFEYSHGSLDVSFIGFMLIFFLIFAWVAGRS